MSEDTRHSPTGHGHKNKNPAAQAPSRSAWQLRKMAELLGPCVKFSGTKAPPPGSGSEQGAQGPSAVHESLCSDLLRGFQPVKPLL